MAAAHERSSLVESAGGYDEDVEARGPPTHRRYGLLMGGLIGARSRCAAAAPFCWPDTVHSQRCWLWRWLWASWWQIAPAVTVRFSESVMLIRFEGLGV
jgi:hypothetical protein